MTLFLSFVLFGFVFEDYDLFHLILLQNFAYDFERLTITADLYTVFVRNEQYVEFDLFADFGIKLFEFDYVAFADFILLASVLDNSVHIFTSLTNLAERKAAPIKRA